MTPNSVGKDTEQVVARWLREHGHPHAERTVRTGYRTANRQLVDAGDIDGTPGLVWQIKSLRPPERAEREIPGWLVETEQQRQAVQAHLGLLVVRRWGTTNAGRWWCFFNAAAFVHLTGGRGDDLPLEHPMPLRMELRDAVRVLHVLGYGEGAAA